MIFLFIILILINFFFLVKFDYIKKLINVYDLPDKKLKKHKKKTPIIGGLILAINFLVIFVYQFFFYDSFIFFSKNFLKLNEYLSILLFIISFFIIGFYDDKNKLSPNKKFLYTFIIVLLFLLLNEKMIIEMFSLSFYENKIFLEKTSLIFTIFCIIILLNSLNFYDGINGQSCLFFIFIFLYLFIKSEFHNFYLIFILLISLILYLNLRNKLFLGDGGIFLVSSIISLSLIYEHNANKNIIYADEIFMLLLLPGLDLLRLTISRLLIGKNPFYGDRNHIHHLLIKRYSLLSTNLILITLVCMPLFFLNFLKLNFFIALSLFVITYYVLIIKLKKND